MNELQKIKYLLSEYLHSENPIHTDKSLLNEIICVIYHD